MSATVYGMYVSPPTMIVILTSKVLGIEVDLVETKPCSGDTKNPEFIQMNPQHCIPTLKDEDGFILWESRAIIRYLAEKQGSTLYPDDLKQRAVVNRLLDFDLGLLYKRFIEYMKPSLQGDERDETLMEGILETLGMLETFLNNSGTNWAAGSDGITLADISMMVSVNCMQMAGIDLGEFPTVSAWLTLVKTEIPDYDEGVGTMIETAFKEFFGKFIGQPEE